MGNGDAVADAGRAETLALQDDIENFSLRQAGHGGCLFREFLKQLLFGIGLQSRNNRILLQQICQCHSMFPVLKLKERRARGFGAPTRFISP